MIRHDGVPHRFGGRIAILILVAATTCLGTRAFGGSLIDLGPGNFIDASSDGSVVLLVDAPNRYYAWTASGGRKPLSGMWMVKALSGDGRWVVGLSSATNGPARMRISDGFLQELPPLSSRQGIDWLYPFAVNSDGSVVSAQVTVPVDENDPNSSIIRKVVKWTNGGAPEDLSGGYFGSPVDISADGTILIGTWDFHIPGEYPHLSVARWSGSGPPEEVLPGCSEAYAVSDDGSVVLFTGWPMQTNGSIWYCDFSTPFTLYRLSPSGGLQPLLEEEDYPYYNHVNSMNPDGSLVLHDESLWSEKNGWGDSVEYLTSLGADLTDWSGVAVYRIADREGAVLAGTGGYVASGETHVWVFNADADGDGILDVWESPGGGIPMPDGSKYDLYALGARPNRKDIFVEVDAMQHPPFLRGFAPSEAAIAMVTSAFDTAPVPAPPLVQNGLPGIALHVFVDETDLLEGAYSSDDFTDLYAEKAFRFGFDSSSTSFPVLPPSFRHERDDPNWGNIKEAKRKVFRYCLFADQFPSLVSGRSEDKGNDFTVTLGGMPIPGGDDYEQAGTFMHELGHTLGLDHGGPDDPVNYKPNYYSVMNYAWEFPAPYSKSPFPAWSPRYSDGSRFRLDEHALSEPNGINGYYLISPFVPQPVPYRIPAGTTSSAYPGHGPCITNPSTEQDFNGCTDYAYFDMPVDWNNNGSTTEAPVPEPPPININSWDYYDPKPPIPDQVLDDHDDWNNLTYNFRESKYYKDGVQPDPGDVKEMTYQEIMFLKSMPSPTVCPAIVAMSPSYSPGFGYDYACSGDSTTFTVTASGTNLTYQWFNYPFTTPIPGQSGNTSAVTNAVADVYRRCTLSNVPNCGTVSADFYLAVANEAPTIVSQPHSVTAEFGAPVEFFPDVTPYSAADWTWTKDGVAAPDLDGALGIYLEHAATTDAGVYVATIRNGCGTVTTDPITLTVSSPAEVTGLRLYADNGMDWDPSTPGNSPETTWDVVRGLCSDLPVGGGTSEVCLERGRDRFGTYDWTIPTSGQCFWYLVRTRAPYGIGPYGWQSNGTPRLTDACAP